MLGFILSNIQLPMLTPDVGFSDQGFSKINYGI